MICCGCVGFFLLAPQNDHTSDQFARWENNFKNRSRASQSARSRGCTGFVFACTTAIEGYACITAQPKKKMSPGVQRSITALSKQWRPLKRRTFPCFSGWIAAPGQRSKGRFVFSEDAIASTIQ